MKHAILGAGAVGGLMGTALGFLGEHVTLIVRPEKLSTYPTKISLERPDHTVLKTSVEAAARASGPFDVLWIATKTYQLEPALDLVESLPTIIVPLLNGIDHIAVLRSRFGSDRVVPATIAVEAVRIAPGSFAHRSPVRLAIASAGEPILKGIVERLRGLGLVCHFVSNEQTLLWSKLCFLAPFALVTSASGKNKSEVFADPQWKAKLDAAITEACLVAKADGGDVDRAQIQVIFDTAPDTMRSSMAKDLAAGRQLELEGIAGPILHRGAQYHIPVPTTEGLVATIQSLVAKSQTV